MYTHSGHQPTPQHFHLLTSQHFHQPRLSHTPTHEKSIPYTKLQKPFVFRPDQDRGTEYLQSCVQGHRDEPFGGSRERPRDYDLRMEFRNIYGHGVARVAAGTFKVTPGNPRKNAEKVVELTREATREHAAVIAFPQMCLTGHLGDLADNTWVLEQSAAALDLIRQQTSELRILILLGGPAGAALSPGVATPLIQPGDSAVIVLNHGRLLALTTAQGTALNPGVTSSTAQRASVFPGAPVLLAEEVPGLNVWAFPAAAPSPTLLQASAKTQNPLLVQLGSEPLTVGAARRNQHRVRELSALLQGNVLSVNGSLGESSTDSAYGGEVCAAADGHLLAQETHLGDAGLTLIDIDLKSPQLPVPAALALAPDPANPTQPALAPAPTQPVLATFSCDPAPTDEVPPLTPPAQRPLVPATTRKYRRDLREAFDIQVRSLRRRLDSMGVGDRQPKVVLGLSGGLDSTLAMLVAIGAKAKLATYTMPGFATSSASRNRAIDLAAAAQIPCEELDIRPAATQMLQTLGHPAGHGEPVYDVTFENVQAGLRADFLFRLANQKGGLVLGTGDLSELALGWCTYGVGDHMSHYGVNGGVPKSLMPDLIMEAIEVLAETDLIPDPAALRLAAAAVCRADITPELIPEHQGASGLVRQTTEGTVGPYLLHDFFLFHTLRGAAPRKVAFLALEAFGEVPGSRSGVGVGAESGAVTSAGADAELDTVGAGGPDGGLSPDDLQDAPHDLQFFAREEILHWLRVFYRRFISQQFKRSAMPDGPVLWEGMSLSPRAGFQFPSDLSAEIVLEQLADLD